MKGKVWAAAWAFFGLMWLCDFVMLFYGVDGSKIVQGCAYAIVVMLCIGNCIASLEKGDHK